MTQKSKLTEALKEFKKKYKNIESADLQTFIIGWNACYDQYHTFNKVVTKCICTDGKKGRTVDANYHQICEVCGGK